jgi:hypothetical protein
MSMAEHWLPIPDWEDLYEASDGGRIRSIDRIVARGGHSIQLKGRILKAARHKRDGRLHVILSRGGKHTSIIVSVAVARTFHGPRPAGADVCHNDGDPGNNRASNLRYDTHSGNMRDMRLHGTDSMLNRKSCRYGHPLKGGNIYWTPRGTRECRTCRRDNARKRNPGARHPDLTEDRVRELRKRVDGGEPRRVLAVEFGISYGQVNRIMQRRAWANVA